MRSLPIDSIADDFSLSINAVQFRRVRQQIIKSAIGHWKSKMTSPTNHCTAPGNAATKGCHHYDVSFTDATGCYTLVKSNRDRGRRSIAVNSDVRIDLRHVNVQTIGNCFCDSLICLVWNEQVNVFCFQSSTIQHIARNLCHRTNRNFEQLVAPHLEEVIASSERISARSSSRTATRRKQLLFVTTVRLDLCSQYSTIAFDRSQDRRASTIAEKNTCLAVGVINVLRQNFSTNH